MKYFLLFLSIFLSLINDTSAQKEKKSGGVAIKVSPLNLLKTSFPTVQGSLEIQLNEKWSLNPEFGIKIPSLYPKPDTSFFTNYSGYKFRLEVRKYLLPVNDGKGYCRAYISASLFYNTNKYNVRSNYVSDTLPVIVSDYEFGVSQKFYGMESRFGLQMVFFHRMLIDCFAGIGIIYKDIENPGRIYSLVKPHDKVRSYYCSDNDTSECSGFALMFPFGIKLGYIITKNRFR